jgi:hypothetical protein
VTTVFRDAELVELLGDEPELLALADALVVTRGRRRGVRPALIAAIAAVVAGVVALALIAPWQGSPTLVDRALAAVGDQPVLHVVVSRPSDPWSLVEIESGRPIEREARTEIWFDHSRDLKKTVLTDDGERVDEILETAEGGWSRGGPIITCAWIAAHPVEATKMRVSCNENMQNGTTPRRIPEKPPTLETALAGFVDRYQSALASGAAHEAGRGRIDGRDVVWLELPTDGQRVAVDADTYKPVVVEAGRAVRFRVVTAETIPFDAALFTKPAHVEALAGSSSRVQTNATPEQAAAALGGSALWLGRQWNGYRLVEVTSHDLSIGYGALSDRAPERAVGAELVYENGARVRFTLRETTVCSSGWVACVHEPGEPGRMLLFPPGGLLRDGALYVVIWNSRQEGQPPTIDIARALRPVASGHMPAGSPASLDRNGCRPGQARAVVRSLVAAFNAGNSAAVDGLVAPEPEFHWFSAPGTSPAAHRLGNKAKDRSTLAAYVRLRHRHHERWANVVIQGNLAITLTRRADDYARSRVHGKGEVFCHGSVAKLIVWSL